MLSQGPLALASSMSYAAGLFRTRVLEAIAVSDYRNVKTTLKDVARAAGVSAATASRAIAGTGLVSGELSSRITAAATRLGYRPNPAARALASRRSGLLAVTVASMDDGVVARAAAAALHALGRHGFGVLVFSEATTERLDIEQLAARGVDGVAFVGRAPGTAERAALAAHGLAWIAAADGDGDDPGCLDLGRLSAVGLACRYLQQIGHQSIGVIAPADLPLGELLRRLRQDGIAIELARSAAADGRVAIRGALRTLIEAPARPTAVVCTDDLAALAVIRECWAGGVAVPGDLAIVGFGDEPFARCSRPALTTVRPGCAELGARAADALVDVLNGRSVAPYAPVNKLVLRETTEPT